MIALKSVLMMLFATLVYSNGIIDARDDDFERLVSGDSGKYSLVYFYSPSCVHCEAFKATWDPLAKLYNNTDLKLIQIDGLTNRKVRSKFNVAAFPTIELFANNGEEIATFGTKAERNVENVIKFVDHYTGILPSEVELNVKYLSNMKDFDNLGNDDVVILFTAPWLKEFENKFNNIFEKTSNIYDDLKFVVVDTSKAELSELSSIFRIDTIPTVLYRKSMKFQKLLNISEMNLRALIAGDDVGQFTFTVEDARVVYEEDDDDNEEDEEEEENDENLAFEEFRKLREL